MSKTWREFWDGAHRIYVNDQHRRIHYARVADDILKEAAGASDVILDYGCGEALEAGRIAAHCGRLLLCESASSLRATLRQRYADANNIAVLSPEEVAEIPDHELDLVVGNSVLQYLSRDECMELLTTLRPKLARDGRLILADIVSPDGGITADVASLLSTAAQNGFLLAAISGLAVTFVSDYRRLRKQIGLTTYRESEIKALLARAGYDAERRPYNFGFNQQRMAIIARSRH